MAFLVLYVGQILSGNTVAEGARLCPLEAPWLPAGRDLLPEQTHSSWRHRPSRGGTKPRHQLGPQNLADLREKGERREKQHQLKITKATNLLSRERKHQGELLINP